MRNTLANLWRPLGGIAISDLGNNRYLYRFYHKVDLERVYAGGPWHFNSHLLLLHKLEKGEDPMVVSLNTSPFWVLVRDVPHGYMSEHFAKVLGNFIGEFMEYDAAAVSFGYKGTMQIRASFDIRKPLKRRKKVALNNGGSVYVRFEYEKLQLFCFICGRIGHGESLCPIRLTKPKEEITFEWDISLRAPSRRAAMIQNSRWLIDEKLPHNISPSNVGTTSQTPFSNYPKDHPATENTKAKEKSTLNLDSDLKAADKCQGNQLDDQIREGTQANFDVIMTIADEESRTVIPEGVKRPRVSIPLPGVSIDDSNGNKANLSAGPSEGVSRAL
ncbi:hypothetical protein HRI_000781500 [Hibiscus trionum]|uniref:CCHC-type domain-containing protein n=1 Tax=Hibiscus trionum TaxID=183268 RepID=A0A9W7H4Z7_HIBTR|nr:hypothetical protein HRI_000781500 [Hibiscus trionum]